MNQRKLDSFLTGVFIGVGLGLVLAPRASLDTKESLRKSFEELTKTIKNVDLENSLNNLYVKGNKIKKELAKIDAKTAKKMLQEKIAVIESEYEKFIVDLKEEEISKVLNIKNRSVNFINDIIDNI